MKHSSCPWCARIRTALLAALLGGGAGFSVLALGGTPEWSMAATFGGALAPVLWHARRNRGHRPG